MQTSKNAFLSNKEHLLWARAVCSRVKLTLRFLFGQLESIIHYSTDPLIKMQVPFLSTVVRVLRLVEFESRYASIDLPVQLNIGTKDQLVAEHNVRRAFCQIASSRKSLNTWNCGHDLLRVNSCVECVSSFCHQCVCPLRSDSHRHRHR